MQNSKTNIVIKIIICIVSILLFTGCWDEVELENRGFVVALGIDGYSQHENSASFLNTEKETQSRFSVTMAMPNLASLENKSADGDNKYIKSANNETVSAAMYLIDSYSGEKIYYGHTKVVVIGEKILKDKLLFSEALDALERNKEISRKLIVLSSEEDASKILSEEIKGEPMLGMFVSEFYRNKDNSVGVTFRNDLENLSRVLRNTENAIIPKIAVENNTIKLGGASVIKDFELVGWLDDAQTRGYLWLKNKAKGAQVITPFEDIYIPMRVIGSKCKINFSEQDNKLICNAKVNIHAIIEEFKFGSEDLSSNGKIKILCELYKNIIEDEIYNTFEIFQNEFKIDGYEFSDILRKKNYELYKKYENNWEETFENMLLELNIDVDIKSVGSVQ